MLSGNIVASLVPNLWTSVIREGRLVLKCAGQAIRLP